VLFVSLSAPKQEFWIKNNLGRVNAYLYAGVGAAFDFMSGEIPRAPAILRSLGLEWAHRHFVDPKRKVGNPIRTSPSYLHLIFILILLNHRSLLKIYMMFRVLKDDGFFRFVGLAIQQVINYEKRYIWIRKFSRELEPAPHLDCKILDEDTLLNLQYNKSIGYVDKFWNIAYGAQRCLGVYEGENLIHFGWLSHSKCPRIDLKEGEAYMGPAITVKEFRRRGGHKSRLIYGSNLLRKEGYTKIYGSSDIANYPSINGLSTSDFRISYIQERLLIFKKTIFSKKK